MFETKSHEASSYWPYFLGSLYIYRKEPSHGTPYAEKSKGLQPYY